MLPALEAPSAFAGQVGGKSNHTSPILLATDGTAQTDQAVGLARLIAVRTGGAVDVLTIVDQLPVPWGHLDSAIATEYERGLKNDALITARRQMNQFGDAAWPVDVEAGDPATEITAAA